MSGLFHGSIMFSRLICIVPCIRILFYGRMILRCMYIGSILIVCRFCICELTFWLRLFVALESVLTALPQSFADVPRAAINLPHPACTFQPRLSAFLFRFSYCEQVAFSWSIYYHVFCIFVLFFGDFTVQNDL